MLSYILSDNKSNDKLLKNNCLKESAPSDSFRVLKPPIATTDVIQQNTETYNLTCYPTHDNAQLWNTTQVHTSNN